MRRLGTICALILAVPILSGCGARNIEGPSAPAALSTANDLRSDGRGIGVLQEVDGSFSGETGPGSQYFLYVPPAWNGDLVLYAHGYTAPFYPIGVPPTEDAAKLRDLVLDRGFAFAYSSYSENGFAVKDGALRTLQLRSLFVAKFGTPRRTFLTGISLGGLIAVQLTERHPDLFAGALPVSGAIGGSQANIQYVGHVRVLFDYFYPGVLPGSLLELPPNVDLQQDIINAAVGAMTAHPEGAAAMSQIEQIPLPFSNGQELVGSIVQALVFHAVELQDLLERTHGHGFFDNSTTVYSGPLPSELLQDLNARVARYESTPDAQRYLLQYYEPTGALRRPVLTLYASRDPAVPGFNEVLYRNKVQAAGASDLLQQRQVVDGYGHPLVSAEQMVAGLGDLVSWADALATP